MSNRSEIKWQPFNAVIPSSLVIKELEEKRQAQTMPILSDDEKELINAQIKRAYHTREKIAVTYFWKNKFYQKFGYINFIDINLGKVYFEDGTSLFFEQFISID